MLQNLATTSPRILLSEQLHREGEKHISKIPKGRGHALTVNDRADDVTSTYYPANPIHTSSQAESTPLRVVFGAGTKCAPGHAGVHPWQA